MSRMTTTKIAIGIHELLKDIESRHGRDPAVQNLHAFIAYAGARSAVNGDCLSLTDLTATGVDPAIAAADGPAPGQPKPPA